MENFGFTQDEIFVSNIDRQHDIIQAEINAINTTADIVLPLTDCRSKIRNLWNNYQWRMRHYFYIHLFTFCFNTLLCGFIIWNIENQQVPFVDCWFIGATCVFTCGLQTYSFPSFSQASQIILLIFTIISGITVSTIPAMIIKIYRAKQEINNKNETISTVTITEDNTLPLKQFRRQDTSDSILNEQLKSLPTAEQLRVSSYIILIILVLSTCFVIYLLSFLIIGCWLKYHYSQQDLSQANRTINPFYASLVISITGFNQNGLSVWNNGMILFVTDVFMNIIIMIVVMSGTSLFPAILRGVINLLKSFAPWRFKIYFDYILLNNHRLSTVIYPSVQTRLYVTITIVLQILGVVVTLILDYNNPDFANYTGGQRFMIFMFLTVNTRFGGYVTINISELAAGSLLVFTLLMGIKPQMLCTINETPFEIEWILLQTEQKFDNKISNNNRHHTIETFLPINRMKDYLLRQSSLTKAQAKQYFSQFLRTDRAEAAINELTEKRSQRRLSNVSSTSNTSNIQISLLQMKLLLIIICRHALIGLFSLIISTRTWLFIFIFLICSFESSSMTPSNPTITVFRVIFEVISAFGGCGLSMGFSFSTPSLATVLSTPSKIILIFTMCMGRHRGLLDSMKDQEEIEYSAQTLIDSCRQLAIYEHQQNQNIKMNRDISSSAIIKTEVARPLCTRF